MSRKSILLIRIFLTLCLAVEAATSARAQRPLGTDVSGFQPSINWTTVKNGGVVFAWAKATEGTGYINPYFTSQESGARGVGIYIGAYHFARPSINTNLTGLRSADSEASYFWSTAGNYIINGGGYLVPMLDWEDPNATNGYVGTSGIAISGFTTAYMSQWVNEWCNSVSNDAAAAGVTIRPVVYTGTWYSTAHSGVAQFPGLNSTVTQWPDWIAAYPANAIAQTGSPGSTTPWASWNIWQYGDTNWSGGDSDVYNGTFPNFLQTFAIGGTNAPNFTTNPTNVVVGLGSNVTFSAQASGQTLVYQWLFNGTAIPGAISNVYTITNVQLANAGGYILTASNSYAKIPSSAAILSVVGSLANAANSVIDPSNIVNWWTGDANGYDIYGTNNSIPTGGTIYTNGKVGLAFRLDGTTGYLPISGGTEIAPNWTACMWVFRQNAPGASSAIMGDGTYSLKLEQYNATREVGISQSGVADSLFSPAYSVPAGKWTHLAFVATSTVVTLFTNGVQEGTVSASGF